MVLIGMSQLLFSNLLLLVRCNFKSLVNRTFKKLWTLIVIITRLEINAFGVCKISNLSSVSSLTTLTQHQQSHAIWWVSSTGQMLIEACIVVTRPETFNWCHQWQLEHPLHFTHGYWPPWLSCLWSSRSMYRLPKVKVNLGHARQSWRRSGRSRRGMWTRYQPTAILCFKLWP